MCAFLIASFALYRSVIFIHELAHLREGVLPGFRLIWNLTCGFPLMVPSFTYRAVHRDHHRASMYGTRSDGEYLPFVPGGPSRIILYLLLPLVLPLAIAGRFIVFTPLSYLNRGLRRVAWVRASSLVINLSYRGPMPSAEDRRSGQIQELGAFLYGTVAIVLVATGILSPGVLLLWYLVAVFVFVLNSLRTLAAHCYRYPGGRAVDFTDQFFDSVDVPGNPLVTSLWAPVGLRYHATHHLFPSMPYHALGEAHRRLARCLPDDARYLEVTRKSLCDALRRLWSDAATARASSRLRPHGA